MNFPNSLFYETVLDLDGKPVKQTDSADSAPLTIKQACRFALSLKPPTRQGEGPDGDKEFKAYELAMKILALPVEGSVDLLTEDIALIKERLAFVHPEVAGYVKYRLEQRNWVAPAKQAEQAASSEL